jgi:hypothetical protein
MREAAHNCALNVQEGDRPGRSVTLVNKSPKRTPKGPAGRSLTIGMDLGDKRSRWSLLDGEDAVVEERQCGDDQESRC